MMPGRDGYEVLRAIKSSESTRHVPVVLLTAKASDAEIWQGWQAGADYYLTKPFNVDELVHYLRLIQRSPRPELDQELSPVTAEQ
jgi:DNA-binding response OmpR family regulator